jgi:phosphoribosylaminoimidazolecarboxamide formyltransferase / IMP cyclohydrolase
MKISQVLAFDGLSQGAKTFLSKLEQLGLEIMPASSSPILGHQLVLIGSFENIINQGELSALRQALDQGYVVLFDPERFPEVLGEIHATGDISEETRRRTAAYALYKFIEHDSSRLASMQGALPDYMVTVYEKVQDLRYGENWHQKAALYRSPEGFGLYNSAKLNGREMSYNNVVDAEAVLEMLIDLSEYDCVPVNKALCVIVKHANPCGVAYGQDLEAAYRASFATDPKSAFGGVIGFNRHVDVKTARAIGDSFVEVLLAPGYDPEALELLTEKKPNRRILDIGDLLSRRRELYSGQFVKSVFGGLLVQDHDTEDLKEWRVVTKRKPTASEEKALRFAWKIAKYVKSNALVYTTEDRTIGIGSGQVSRVDSARFGAEKAEEHGLSTQGSVAATDSFFPFRDGLEETHKAGATAVIHPGGSIRDAEVIQAADEYEMAMVFTGMRHFRH